MNAAVKALSKNEFNSKRTIKMTVAVKQLSTK